LGVSIAARLRLRRLHRRRFVDNDGTHAGEIKASQERTHGQLARTAQVHQKLHDGGTQFAEFARKLVRRRQFGRVRLPRQEFRPRIGQRPEEPLEVPRQPGRFLFAVHALVAAFEHGQRDAKNLGRLIVREVSHELGEKRQPVGLGEKHIHRKLTSHGLRDLA
jgi:hypothetical protein